MSHKCMKVECRHCAVHLHGGWIKLFCIRKGFLGGWYLQWSQGHCLTVMVWNDAHLLCAKKKNCSSCYTQCSSLPHKFLVEVWWMTLLPCLVLSPVQDRASKLAVDIVLMTTAALSRRPLYPVQCASETPSSVATILTHLLKKGATICPIFASLHYRLGGKEPHLLTVTV